MDFKKQQNEAVSGWFSQGDARVKFKTPDLTDLEAGNSEVSVVKSEFVHNPVLGKLERVEWKEDKDPNLRIIALGARMIVEWENVEFEGKKLKCTEENKRKLLAESIEFREFYVESMKALTEQVQKEYGSDIASKNSKRMPAKK